MLRVLFLISFLFLTLATLAQEELHTRRSKLAEAFKEAKELVEIGNLYKSEVILNDILKKDESFDEAILLLHEVHIKRDQPDRANAIIANYSAEVEQRFLNRLLVIQANYHYQLGEYEQARKLLSNVNSPVYQIGNERVTFLRESIEFSIEQSGNPLEIDFEKLPEPLNKFEQQYFPSITAEGKIIFTMRDKLGRGDEDLYSSYLYKEGVWSEPINISSQINTERNEGSASISADGKTLVFTICNKPGNIGSCDLYISYLESGDWTTPKLLGPEVNSTAWDSQPSLTADGQTLYFVSMREGGLGKQDIWMSEKIGDNWLPAVNLGPDVNTVEDDCSPFIYLDGETLIFSTRGRIGMGGYDLFKSIRKEAGWSIPQNLGSPINDAFDQIGYCISVDRWAYFSSSVAGGGIYLQRFKVPESIVNPVDYVVPSEPGIIGKVVNGETNDPVSAIVKVAFDSDTLMQSVADDGRFIIKEDDFSSITATKNGYRNVQVPKSQFVKDSTLRLMPFRLGENLLTSNVLFHFDSDVLKDQALPVLDEVVKIINEYPELKLEVQGHTDIQGDDNYNLDLSSRRAAAVYNYLIERISKSSQLSFKGYGEQSPIYANDPVENRRVEVVIVGVVGLD